MRVLYGIQGTGNGHLARARLLLPALKEAGVEVDVLISGADEHSLFDMQVFADYRMAEGFSFITRNGAIDVWATLKNVHGLNFIREVKALDVRGYDVVLNDLEPVSAWAAKWRGVRSMGLSNQYAMQFAPAHLRPNALLRSTIGIFAPVAETLPLHWQPFHARVLPPLTDPADVVAPHPEEAAFVLVYLPVESLQQVIACLKAVPEAQFHVYAPAATEEQNDNVRLVPLSRERFRADMAACAGVLCNSGFGVCTEALQAGKKILTVPLHGQFEQVFNARLLEHIHRGTVMHALDPGFLRAWLEAPGHTPVHFPDTARALAQWFADGAEKPVEEVAAALWQQVTPEGFKRLSV